MLRWPWKKSEGFEWREYVRTTILVRRKRRQEKVADAKAAAVAGLEQAGRAGMAAGVKGAGHAGRAVAAGLAGLGRLPGWIGRRAAPAVAPLARGLAASNLGGPLTLLGGAGLVGGLLRAVFSGLDRDALLAAGIGAVALLLGLLPAMAAGRLRSPAWLSAAAPRISGVASVLAGGVLVVLVAGAAGWALARYLAPNSAPTTAVLAGLQKVGIPIPAQLTPAVKPITGRASALGGDALRVGDVSVRLSGIEAPDEDQPCGLAGKRSKRCGEAAREAMTRIVRGKSVTCTLSGSDDSGQSLATCHAEGTDIAAALVRQGHVFAQQGLFSRYGSAEIEARTAKVGFWKDNVQRPAEWRAKRWDEAKKAAPDGCPIKGAVIPDGKIYVLPWSRDYDRTRVRTTRGERWFCSEQEARAAGWRAADRS
jgi:endonuclease YncB( thermonuclease family)